LVNQLFLVVSLNNSDYDDISNNHNDTIHSSNDNNSVAVCASETQI